MAKENAQKSLVNPRVAKVSLAKEVVAACHSREAADEAEKEFNRVFREKKTPSKIPTVQIKEKFLNILDLLVRAGLASSRSEAQRLAEQGGVEIDGKVVRDRREQVTITKGQVIRAGKRRFAKID